jgi:hypothetical protein
MTISEFGKVARTDQEIIDNYDNKYLDPSSSNLVAYYQFNEGIPEGDNSHQFLLLKMLLVMGLMRITIILQNRDEPLILFLLHLELIL